MPRLAEVFHFDLSEALTEVWVAALVGIPPGLLARAFAQLLKTWRPEFGRKFPAPADLRALITDAQNALSASEAENSWNDLLRAIDERYHPDIRPPWRGPKLSPRIEHAARAAGGIPAIFNRTTENEVWQKKKFVECYLRDEELPQSENLIGPRPVVKLFQEVARRKELAPPPSPPRPATLAAPPVAREKVSHSEIVLTDEREALLKKQQREILKKYPPKPGTEAARARPGPRDQPKVVEAGAQ